MNSKLSLRWRDHHSALITMLENHLDNSTLSDCVIAAEGQYIKAHKVVLSSCSPYFQLLFTLENEKNPIVVLKDVKFDDLKAVIDFVYRGEVQVFEDQLVTFLETAESLQIKGLGRNNNERFGKRKKGDSSGKRSRERSNTPTPEENTVKRPAYEAEEEALELVPVLEDNQGQEWKNKRESYCSDLPSTSSRNIPPAYNFRSSTRASSAAQTSAINLEIAPALPEPSLSAEDCLAETESVVKTESLSDSEMGHAEEYMDDALSEGGADSFIKNDMEDIVGPNTGHPVDQPSMRNHYGGGPSSQTDPTNLTSDNSMRAPQIGNSQDFMLGLGALDSSGGGAVTGGHISTEPSTSQGDAALHQPMLPPPPLRHRSVQLRQSLHRKLTPSPEQPSADARPVSTAREETDSELLCAKLGSNSALAVVSPDKEFYDRVNTDGCAADSPPEIKKFDEKCLGGSSTMSGKPVIGDVTKQIVSRQVMRGSSNLEIPAHSVENSSHFYRDVFSSSTHAIPTLVFHETLRSSGDAKDYSCPMCSKTFLKATYLKEHLRIHSGEKRYVCETCGARFTQANSLVYHKRTHTGERPYRCEVCGLTFATSSPLYRHKRKMHGTIPESYLAIAVDSRK